MMNSNDILKKLSKDVERLQNKIDHKTLYNVYDIVMKLLIKSGIAIDYALPFILAAIIVANSGAFKKNAPFRVDDVIGTEKIETIDTSSGIHEEHTSFDFNYDDEVLEHSTGWIINERGLYERTETSYRLNNSIDISDVDRLLSMSKEEIDDILVITNIKKICKSSLSPEDSIYNSDALIIINHSELEENTITRKETTDENIINSIIYILLALGWGYYFGKFEKIFVKTYIRDILREYEPLFRPIRKKELETVRKILDMKRQNLNMISNSSHNLNSIEEFSYSLRRTQKGE